MAATAPGSSSGSKALLAADGGPSTRPAQRPVVVDAVPVLDAETAAILGEASSLVIRQQVNFGEALTAGLWEQKNTYAVFDAETGAELFVAREESECCDRVCCAPNHPLKIHFYAGASTGGTQEFKSLLIRPPADGYPESLFTLSKPGCVCPDIFRCCCKHSSKCEKCPPCFACGYFCQDEMTVSRGGQPFAAVIEPRGGGGFTPTLQVMERPLTPADREPAYAADSVAVIEGPHCFGGCSEYCCDAPFAVSRSRGKAGDVASIRKRRPRDFKAFLREAYTDSDVYQVDFIEAQMSPQQKAATLAAIILADYKFFEMDRESLVCPQGVGFSSDGKAIIITCFFCSCYGCLCPCQICIPISGDN